MLFVCCLCLVTAAQERRRRIKKKIIKTGTEDQEVEAAEVTGRTQTEVVETSPDTLNKPKEPRG